MTTPNRRPTMHPVYDDLDAPPEAPLPRPRVWRKAASALIIAAAMTGTFLLGMQVGRTEGRADGWQDGVEWGMEYRAQGEKWKVRAEDWQ